MSIITKTHKPVLFQHKLPQKVFLFQELPLFQLFFCLSHRHTHQIITKPPLSLPLLLPALPLFIVIIRVCRKSFSCILTVPSPPLKGAGGMLIIDKLPNRQIAKLARFCQHLFTSFNHLFDSTFKVESCFWQMV